MVSFLASSVSVGKLSQYVVSFPNTGTFGLCSKRICTESLTVSQPYVACTHINPESLAILNLLSLPSLHIKLAPWFFASNISKTLSHSTKVSLNPSSIGSVYSVSLNFVTKPVQKNELPFLKLSLYTPFVVG